MASMPTYAGTNGPSESEFQEWEFVSLQEVVTATKVNCMNLAHTTDADELLGFILINNAEEFDQIKCLMTEIQSCCPGPLTKLIKSFRTKVSYI